MSKQSRAATHDELTKRWPLGVLCYAGLSKAQAVRFAFIVPYFTRDLKEISEASMLRIFCYEQHTYDYRKKPGLDKRAPLQVCFNVTPDEIGMRPCDNGVTVTKEVFESKKFIPLRERAKRLPKGIAALGRKRRD